MDRIVGQGFEARIERKPARRTAFWRAYGTSAELANRLLCETLGQLAKKAFSPYGENLFPIVTVFGVRYGLSGDLTRGALYPVNEINICTDPPALTAHALELFKYPQTLNPKRVGTADDVTWLIP